METKKEPIFTAIMLSMLSCQGITEKGSSNVHNRCFDHASSDAYTIMNYRTLGCTGLRVSEIGFGAWGIGGVNQGAISYGPTDDTESREALKCAFDLGITFYDTADLYGHGHSERLIGETFKEIRNRVVIASKGGLLDQNGHQDFSPAHIEMSVDGSLKRLQSDYIDVYQLHDPPLASLGNAEEIVDTLQSLERAGKIRSWGISVRCPDDGLLAIEHFGANVLQVNFNMADQRMLLNGLMGLCETKRVGLICRTPLCFGFLTGRYTAETEFGAYDHRSRWSSEQLDLWSAANQRFSTIRRTEDQTDAQLALRYCLSYPAVSTAIPGMLRKQHVEENVDASYLGALAEEKRMKIEEVYNAHQFYAGEKGVLKP